MIDLTVVSILVQGKTVLSDDSAEIGSIHDKEQRSENRPPWNAIQDRHDWRQMTAERYLPSSAAD